MTDVKELISIRKKLHENPELSLNEKKTMDIICDFLKEKSDFKIFREKDYVYALHFEGEECETVMFRADMDAICDENEKPFHGCGHDGHMAILIGVAEELKNKKFSKNVILLFQPAEEVGKGAELCLEIFDKMKIDRVYGLHNFHGYKEGAVACKSGIMFMASCGLVIELVGRQSHASMPELGLNPAYFIADLVKELKIFTHKDAYKKSKFMGRSFEDEVLLTVIGVNIGGENFGVSPQKGRLALTLRAKKDSDLESFIGVFESEVKKIAEKSGFSYKTERHDEFLAVINDEELYADFKERIINEGLDFYEMKEPVRSSEDFSYYKTKAKSVFFLIGNGENYTPLHYKDYEFNDRILENAIRAFISLLK